MEMPRYAEDGYRQLRKPPAEFWANVMVCEGADGRLYSGFGPDFPSKSDADVMLRGNRNANRFRIHVRLKPEGAPRRYATEGERLVWQDDPDWARGVIRSRSHEVAERMIESRAGQLLRSPKTEESAS